MAFDLAAMWRRQRNPRRRSVQLRPILPPATLTTSLYHAAYREVVRAWEAAVPAIMAEYERSLAQITTDSPGGIASVISQVEAQNATVLVSLRARIERWARLLEQFHRRKWRSAVLSATSVDLQTMIGPEDARLALETSIERNVALVRSVSDEARQRIADAAYRALTERKPARETAAVIREAVAMSRRRALNIAADQTVKLASALDEERRRQAGISAWVWVHSGKMHPRQWHRERDGKVYSDDPAQVGSETDGETIHAPPEDRPGMLPYCGCTSRAVLVL